MLTLRNFKWIAIVVLVWVVLFMSSAVSNAGMSRQELESYWHQSFDDLAPSSIPEPTATLRRELLAKAQADECFAGIGAPYPPGPPCGGGVDKINQGYVFGMTKSGEQLWFGTSPNQLCTVLGTYLATMGVDPPSFINSALVCEYGMSQMSPPLPTPLGDWRAPEIWLYNTETGNLENKTPYGDLLLQETLGIRSAGTLGNVVILAGPNIAAGFYDPADPQAETAVNFFAFRTDTGAYLGSKTFTQYTDIRKWLVVEGHLYTGVQYDDLFLTGRVLRWAPPRPLNLNIATIDQILQFEEVGQTDAEAAELAYHEDRIVVTTWAPPLGLTFSGVFVSPPLGGNPLPESSDPWTKIWDAADYEPDPAIAKSYYMGAISPFGDYVYWGTINFPLMSFLMHMTYYEALYDPIEDHLAEVITAFVGSWRTISLFRAKNLGSATPEIEVVNGLDLLPAFDPPPPAGSGTGWSLLPNKTGPVQFGLMGFGNIFNAYTWSMANSYDQLFVGTMDFSYMIYLGIETLLQAVLGDLSSEGAAFLETFLDFDLSDVNLFMGADLYRFPSVNEGAMPESLNGLDNIDNYGIRNMVADEALYLGMANPMNLSSRGGWELIRLSQERSTPVPSIGPGAFGVVAMALGIAGGLGLLRRRRKRRYASTGRW